MKLFGVLLFALATCIAAVNAQVSGSSASTVGQRKDETGTATREPSVFSTPKAGKIKGELTTEMTSTVEALTTEGIHTSSPKSTSTTVLSSTKNPSVNQENRTGVKMDYHGVFYYDEQSLRKWGLVAAAILFILGILILTCGKHGKLLRCRGKKRTRNYDVTQA